MFSGISLLIVATTICSSIATTYPDLSTEDYNSAIDYMKTVFGNDDITHREKGPVAVRLGILNFQSYFFFYFAGTPPIPTITICIAIVVWEAHSSQTGESWRCEQRVFHHHYHRVKYPSSLVPTGWRDGLLVAKLSGTG